MGDVVDHQRGMRLLVRRGAYAAAAAYALALEPVLRAHPVLCVEAARARMRQGRMRDAEAVLQSVDLSLGTPGARLVTQLERAAVTIYRGASIAAAIEVAAEILHAADGGMAPADKADAERVYVRMLLQAMVYRELPAARAHEALSRLPDLAEVLEGAGRPDESLAARLTYAEQHPDEGRRLQLLADVVERADHLGHLGVAAEARVSRADRLLKAGAAREAVEAELAEAASCYAQIGHEHGPIDVASVRAVLVLDRDLGPPDALLTCLNEYLALGYARGALSVLLDLSQLAHQRGDMAAAAALREQGVALAEDAGMDMALENFRLAQVDVLMRAADFRGAIELARGALSTTRSRFFAASYEQLLSTAFGLAGDGERAIEHGRAAIAAYAELGDEDTASDAVLKLASDLGSLREPSAAAEAEHLLRDWLARDLARGDADAAIGKHELLAQLRVNEYLYGSRQHDQALIAEAEGLIVAGEALAATLPRQTAALRRGGLAQLRGQLAQLRGDVGAVVGAWAAALEDYDRAGLALYAANCRYILGALALNRANEELQPAFGDAEDHLRSALAFYDAAGMRSNAADARFMLARLYANAAVHVLDLAEQLLDAALDHLREGELDYDAIRRDYTVGSVLDDQRGKQSLAARSARLYTLILEIFVRRGDPGEVWRWAQRAKARALGDTLGMRTAVPARVLEAANSSAEARALLGDERELLRRIELALAEDRGGLRSALDGVRARMAAQPTLADYLDLRSGAAVELGDLEALLGGHSSASTRVVCIDWVAVDERLLMVSWRPGEQPAVTPLQLRVSEVAAFVATQLSPLTFRATLRDMPELLRRLDPLVAPLAACCEPGELLVLAPTGPVHAVPLHALHLVDEPLLVRNPVVYTPSLSALRHCLARTGPDRGAPVAALLGDPTDDRPSAAAVVERLARAFGVTALIGGQVTRAAFQRAAREADLIHFQGHAVHQPEDPLGSYLRLADGDLAARDLFAISDFRPQVVTLAACESAASVIRTGDEPLGLIPALLFAGAGAVVATLWRVQAQATAEVMTSFYAGLRGGAGPAGRAEALRAAMLEQRGRPGRSAPYYWAPFVLYGDWASEGGGYG